MANETCTYERLNRALEGYPVWDIGQLSKLDVKVLNQAVRAGKLRKARAHWMSISPLKTVWYREGFEPQEVMAAEYYAQKRNREAA